MCVCVCVCVCKESTGVKANCAKTGIIHLEKAINYFFKNLFPVSYFSSTIEEEVKRLMRFD